MKKLQAEGKIRVPVCSNFGPRDLTELLEQGRVEVDQVSYNLLWRGIEDELQDICVENGVSILPYCPLAQALLTGKFQSADDVPEGRARTRLFSAERPRARHGEQGAEEAAFEAVKQIGEIAEDLGEPMARVALAWLLSRSAVASVLAGMRNAEQARENARTTELELPDDVLDRLTRATEPLRERFEGEIDMWQSKSRIR
jgi:aryl-alcohol dehydrogenase-like predicted oxidoreductase